MIKKIYLLDTNIVIRIWKKYPKLLDNIDKLEEIDFKIHQDIAGELCRKEFNEINGIPILSDRFIKLLSHIINNDDSNSIDFDTYSDFIKHDSKNNMYFVNRNKISVNDFTLIRSCKKYKEYILVTEDKKMISSAKLVIDSSRVFDFDKFIEDLKNYDIW